MSAKRARPMSAGKATCFVHLVQDGPPYTLSSQGSRGRRADHLVQMHQLSVDSKFWHLNSLYSPYMLYKSGDGEPFTAFNTPITALDGVHFAAVPWGEECDDAYMEFVRIREEDELRKTT